MGNEFNGYSLSDIAAATGGNRGNGGFGDNSGWWIILLLLALGGNNGFGGGYGGGGAGSTIANSDFAWLSNGQKEIMQNTNNGFDTLQLANHMTSINDGIQNLSTQLCNCCADMNQTVSSGFANAETAANARQMADMQQNYTNQLNTQQSFNMLNSSLNQCLKKIQDKANEFLNFTNYEAVGTLAA